MDRVHRATKRAGGPMKRAIERVLLTKDAGEVTKNARRDAARAVALGGTFADCVGAHASLRASTTAAASWKKAMTIKLIRNWSRK